MVLSDFLSRQQVGDSNPHELIPISFSLRHQVSDYFYHIDNEIKVTKKGQILPEMHGANKGLDPHVQPGKPKVISYSNH